MNTGLPDSAIVDAGDGRAAQPQCPKASGGLAFDYYRYLSIIDRPRLKPGCVPSDDFPIVAKCGNEF
jgi:hypothetical protein